MTGVQTCALPISAKEEVSAVDEEMGKLESAKKAEQKQSKVIVRSVSAAVVERQ